MYIDVHCHLDDGAFGDLDELVERASEAGVARMITSGVDLESSLAAMAISERYPSVYFTAGFQPTETGKYRKGDMARLEEILSHPRCVAVGEIGLDYHYPDTTDRPLQTAVFLGQLELAARAGLPVVIHSRDSAADMMDILSAHRDLLACGALLHCYSHSPEMALEFEKLGCRFSFGGTSTYRGSKKARRCIAALAPSSLLTETDSPYLPPESMRGAFPNTPLSIPEIAGRMAETRGVTEEELCGAVWDNAHALFRKLG